MRREKAGAMGPQLKLLQATISTLGMTGETPAKWPQNFLVNGELQIVAVFIPEEGRDVFDHSFAHFGLPEKRNAINAMVSLFNVANPSVFLTHGH